MEIGLKNDLPRPLWAEGQEWEVRTRKKAKVGLRPAHLDPHVSFILWMVPWDCGESQYAGPL